MHHRSLQSVCLLACFAAAGAMEHMRAHLLTYVPAYRSEAGTGCGMAFARWDL